ncbi:Uroporphyrinogen decarboxylase [Porphyridium purpureum]|uniref:Uroporphyrinogen decarboxylase n=1 Tax=Porphyridium purpureum TaxID=35688 RepID=A0A5J4YNE6_PORPP|nr:Uroporphyrinogen decarboxylase [Porphyridium purpureum]|eukprot:POR9415..scf222_8
MAFVSQFHWDCSAIHGSSVRRPQPRATAPRAADARRRAGLRMVDAPAQAQAAASATAAAHEDSPLLVRAAKGLKIERPPAWMMRQAGRYMKVYQDLAKKHTSFRERSETADLSTEISLQPWNAFKPDGVILFSDILTPLPGMGIEFDILEDKGPVIQRPIRSLEDVKTVHEIDSEKTCPFVKETLGSLRREVGNASTVLGFVGAPYTLATYCIEGKTSRDYLVTKKMMYTEPQIMHALLSKIADNIADYACYQIESGAQVVQVFDSWAGVLSPIDFDAFSAPYHKQIVDKVKARHPDTSLIVYISQGATLIERMAKCGYDVVSLDWTIDMAEARARLGPDVKVQGNMDPAVLYADKAAIEARILDTIHKAGNVGHIVNLGHGVMPTTPEENVAFYFETVQKFRY